MTGNATGGPGGGLDGGGETRRATDGSGGGAKGNGGAPLSASATSTISGAAVGEGGNCGAAGGRRAPVGSGAAVL